MQSLHTSYSEYLILANNLSPNAGSLEHVAEGARLIFPLVYHASQVASQITGVVLIMFDELLRQSMLVRPSLLHHSSGFDLQLVPGWTLIRDLPMSKPSNTAIHLSRPLMIFVDLHGFLRPGDGKR
jgi:hypothetical protein